MTVATLATHPGLRSALVAAASVVAPPMPHFTAQANKQGDNLTVNVASGRVWSFQTFRCVATHHAREGADGSGAWSNLGSGFKSNFRPSCSGSCEAADTRGGSTGTVDAGRSAGVVRTEGKGCDDVFFHISREFHLNVVVTETGGLVEHRLFGKRQLSREFEHRNRGR